MDELIGLFGVSEEDGNEHSYEAQLISDSCQHQVQPEVEEGNVEFKLKLVNPSASRMEHLVTQMKWRLREGHGEAIYQIGVEDRGAVLGLCKEELDASLSSLNQMAQRLNADVTIVREVIVDEVLQTKAVEVLVRKIPSDKPFIDVRVSVLGNVDCGKSSFVGVLCTRQLDSGRGRARLNLLKHPHEIQTGHTSSICHEILGFDSHGQTVDYSVVRNKEEICEMSSKLLTFIDLPGGQKSLKTTIFGLTGYNPDYALILIAANQGIVGITREHFALALALNIPCAILITKSDLLSPTALAMLKTQIKNVLQLPGVGKICLFVDNDVDAIQAASSDLHLQCLVPVFTTSSVTGQGMDLLKAFFNILPSRSSCDHQSVASANVGTGLDEDPDSPFYPDTNSTDVESQQPDVDFKIDETYSVPNVGCVVGGILHRGVIRKGDEMFLGPFSDGRFSSVKVSSLHRVGRAPCSIVKESQSAAIAIKPNYAVRKGMVLLGSFSAISRHNSQVEFHAGTHVCMNKTSEMPEVGIHRAICSFRACLELEAEILILFHPRKIFEGFQCTLHIDNIVQSATIQSIVLPRPDADAGSLVDSACRHKTTSLSEEGEVNSDLEQMNFESSSLPPPSEFSPTNRKGSKEGNYLCTNRKGHVTFRFVRHCEYVTPGMRILLRQGNTKGIGNVTKIFPYLPPTS